ncbi:hypothetical protein H9I45_06600 [Polaribacter haliotis]|uniref:Uncharacterized protein n=1 Tax=Polaribacter haliotis TaxID=1888915 RepID=A0A7L8AJC4_9FLAO|nr:hypothetical protein [Polaribacter haliotis]QOD62106.1 hypothetical protein H9I45_06600 [Polaribacter haliotis]
MIATKLLGFSAALTKSKKIKIAILLVEIAILAYAYKKNKEEQEAQLYIKKDKTSCKKRSNVCLRKRKKIELLKIKCYSKKYNTMKKTL